MKKTWTKELAVETLKSFIVDGKIVNFKGKGSLRQCSAADYLSTNHGFIIDSTFVSEEN